MAGQGALANVFELGAGPAVLLVSAIMKMPVAAQLRTAWLPPQVVRNHLPGRIAMLLYEIFGDLIGDTLVAQNRHQPVEQHCCVMTADCASDTLCSE